MTSTAVATQETSGAITLPAADAATTKKFLEAFTNAQLDRLPPDQQAAFLMNLGRHIGVRAELGELILYQGKPYLTIDARYRLAHSSGLLTGLEVRPATTMERRNYGVAEGIALWVASVYRRGAMRAFTGWGEAGGPNDKNPISKHSPAKMAKKRARYDGLRSAFPIAEELSELHQHYIEEAEKIAAGRPIGTTPLIPATYDDDDDYDPTDFATGAADEAGHDAAATAERGGKVTEAQTSRLLDLIYHPRVPETAREKIEARLKSGGLSSTLAETWIAALEVQINPPAAAAGDASNTDDTLPLGIVGGGPKHKSAIEQGH